MALTAGNKPTNQQADCGRSVVRSREGEEGTMALNTTNTHPNPISENMEKIKINKCSVLQIYSLAHSSLITKYICS